MIFAKKIEKILGSPLKRGTNSRVKDWEIIADNLSAAASLTTFRLAEVRIFDMGARPANR
jgi:hypothetical protein